MLEYLLLRGDGRALFRNHAVRFVVLDEVHTYKGALGTDVACLVRRLRAALGEANPLFIGTSATLQSGAGDPRTGVAEFFAHLTGQPTPAESVIRERTAAPALPEGLSLAPPPQITAEDLGTFSPDDAGTGAGVDPETDELQCRESGGVLGIHGAAVSPAQLAERSVTSFGRCGKTRCAAGTRGRDGRARFSGRCRRRCWWVRVWSGRMLCVSVRASTAFCADLARFWRCTNATCGKLLDSGVGTCDACGCRSLPLAFAARADGTSLLAARKTTPVRLPRWRRGRDAGRRRGRLSFTNRPESWKSIPKIRPTKGRMARPPRPMAMQPNRRPRTA